ncbi:MAG: PAS domain S-box protein, partial [Spirochaetaceae bacterium]|nr:PAS domain S-box protein [Spirochaetaceae bacterium]
PLTLMASFATNGFNGLSAESYRDYRGVPVFGSWRWKPNYNFGIVAEIDVEDGMQYFYSIRNSLIALLSVTVLLAVGMTLVSLSLSNKAHIALSESRVGLEEKVINRTRELSMANRNLNNTIEALTHPFYVIDAKTYEIVLANKTAIEQGAKGAGTCYALTHFSEKICSGIDHECPLDRVMKTKKPYVTEHLHRDRDGKERFVEVHGYPILDENSEVVQMIEYNLDITDRKIAEIKIKDNEKRLQSLLEAGPDGMIIIDENHLISQVNMQTERIFGYQRDELVGKSLEILVPQLGENERDKIWNGNLGSNFETKERSTLELFAQRMDGSSFPIDISMSPIRTIEGMFMVTSVRDITVRKDTELTMKQNIEELELFNKLTIGREEKMIELKGEINELLKQFDMPEKYIIVTDEDEA